MEAPWSHIGRAWGLLCVGAILPVRIRAQERWERVLVPCIQVPFWVYLPWISGQALPLISGPTPTQPIRRKVSGTSYPTLFGTWGPS